MRPAHEGMPDLDYSTLELLRLNHPAWRLLRSDHAALIVSFLHRVFVAPNARAISQSDLAASLEDLLFELRERLGAEAFPRSAVDYLGDWSGNDRGWLRRFYPADSDEPHFDLTPATEKAIRWLAVLGERSFVGTESRLLILVDLLKQMVEGSETDASARIADLERRRRAIDEEIAAIEAGHLPMLDDTAIKDRFQQFVQVARDLLLDFREVEQNFRILDRRVREQIAMWDGAKGDLLEEIMGARDAIVDTDQGRSFRAFWSFLMSARRQDELTRLLDRVLALDAVTSMGPDARLRRVHYDWLEAGEHTQRTVAQLSQQLRRFLDDQAWLENRRIMDILHEIESNALGVRQSPPPGPFMEIAEMGAAIELPMERPLYTPSVKTAISDVNIEEGDAEIDLSVLFDRVVIDKSELAGHVRHVLQTRTQATLCDVLAVHPLHEGLAELVTYVQIASESPQAVVDESHTDVVEWDARDGRRRRARLPRIIFARM